MDALWPDLGAEAAGTNLRKATHYLRRALGNPDPVVIDGGVVALRSDWSVTIDVETFDAAAKEALGEGAEACAKAAALYGGELLPEDRYESWAFEPRERLRLRHIQLLKLANDWEAVLEVDPADEEAHRALMLGYIESGNRQGALRQFARLRDVLHVDLGIGPDQSSIELYEKAVAMEGVAPPSAALQVGGLIGWGLVHWNRMELDEAGRCAEQARALAIDGGLGRELGEATCLWGMVAHAQGRWREVFRTEFEEMVRDRSAMASYTFEAQLCLAEIALYGPDSHTEIEPFAAALLSAATDAGSLAGQGLAWLLTGEAALLAGRLADAQRALARATKLNRDSAASSALALTLIRSAEASIAAGRRWQASKYLDQAMAVATTAPLAAHLLSRGYNARILAAKGDERAVMALDDAERALHGAVICPSCSIGFEVTASITRARSGDLERAESHLETAARIATMWQGGPWQAAVWEARGTLRVAAGDPSQGIALFNEAASLFEETSRPLDAARCRAAAA